MEEVELQMRRFETFTKALVQLEERISALNTLAQQLIDQKHMEAENIELWNQKVLSALNNLGSQLDSFRRRLEFALVLARFDNEVKEMSGWIDDKIKHLQSRANDRNNQESLSLSDKLEHLKRHQALEIELSTNAPRIEALQSQLNTLKRGESKTNEYVSTVALNDIVRRGEHLMVKWRELNKFIFVHLLGLFLFNWFNF